MNVNQKIYRIATNRFNITIFSIKVYLINRIYDISKFTSLLSHTVENLELTARLLSWLVNLYSVCESVVI